MSSSNSVSERGSVSRLVRDFARGNEDAIRHLCDRYYEQLAIVARQKLGGFPRRVFDEYAIANEVMQEFHDRVLNGEFDNVRDRCALLAVLVRLTKDKVIDEVRRLTADKRGGGQTRGHSIFLPTSERAHQGDFDRFQGAVQSPSARYIVREEIQHILERLPDEICRTILLLRCEGYTNEEIAEQLNVSVATVERKRRRIRDRLADLRQRE